MSEGTMQDILNTGVSVYNSHRRLFKNSETTDRIRLSGSEFSEADVHSDLSRQWSGRILTSLWFKQLPTPVPWAGYLYAPYSPPIELIFTFVVQSAPKARARTPQPVGDTFC